MASQTTPSTHESLRLGKTAPNFTADTTHGKIDFHKYLEKGIVGEKVVDGSNGGEGWWTVLFAHPQDFTPVCTTELGAFAKAYDEFSSRRTRLIGLSADDIDSHHGWLKDVGELAGCSVKYPVIADPERKVACLYDMIDHQDITNVDKAGKALTIRSVFIIDSNKKIRTILSYPASTGRNISEILRVIDSMQTSDRMKITTPANWKPGEDVIVHPSVSTEEAEKMYPKLNVVKPYLRFTPLEKEKVGCCCTKKC